MKRNLRKVISTVLALSLSLSSFMALGTASSAATFTDVADTASYSEAVEALAALGAISGYEDGTFLPNNNITRAEVTTMVVAALNMTNDAKNSGSTTQFADVNANAAWAAGYVNVGVAQGFISGMSATEFAPSDNVTYAQILTMLTRILGYGEFAESRGGYPNGYLSAAATAGILSGVSASANDAMTRAQVAQLIWNAVQAPVLDITTFSTSLSEQKMEKLDGNNGRDFRTLLSDKFDAYVLNVTIDSNSRGGENAVGEIEMTITGTNDFDPDENSLVKNYGSSANPTKKSVKVGKTAAEDYLFSSAKVVAEYNDDNEWTLLYLAPTTKVATKVVDGTLIAANDGSDREIGISYKDDKGDATETGKLKIKRTKSSSTTTNYTLTSDAKLYVNGVDFGEIKGNEDAVRDLIAESTGDTTLVEGDKSNNYKTVMIDYYAIASVNQVTSKNGTTKVSTSAPIVNKAIKRPGNSFEVTDDDLADGEVTVSVTKAGAAAELTSLATDDVIAIKYDVTKTIDESNFIEIIATNETVSGKYSGYDEEEETYAVAGQDYEATQPITLTIGATYVFRMDPFGKIFEADEETTSKNFAIVETYVDVSKSTSSSADTDYMRVVTLDGQVKTLYMYSSYQSTARDNIKAQEDKVSAIPDDAQGTLTDKKFGTNVGATSVPMAYRIIEYTVRNSDGKVNKFNFVDGESFKDQDYKQATNRLNKTLSDTAVVLDATDYDEKDKNTSDYKASSLAALGDGVKYDGILLHKNNNNEYAYVIITKAGSVFSGTSEVVVAAANGSTSSQAQVDGEDVYTLNVMKDGNDEAEKLNLSMNVEVFFKGAKQVTKDNGVDLSAITRGSAFVYTTDSDGFVDEINILYKAESSYATLLQKAVTSKDSAYLSLPNSENIAAADWAIDLDDSVFTGEANEEIQVVLGIVTDSTSNRVNVANVAYDDTAKAYYVSPDDAVSFNITSDSKIYSFDMDGTTGTSAFSTGAFAVSLSRNQLDDGKAWLADIDNKTNFTDAVQVAFLVVVDGAVQTGIVMDD